MSKKPVYSDAAMRAAACQLRERVKLIGAEVDKLLEWGVVWIDGVVVFVGRM